MITSCAPTPFIRSNIPSPSRSRPPSTLSAGNLFGTTRRSQPDVFGADPLWRYASTSGGVRSSRPAQNRQCSNPSVVTGCTWNVLGRFWRSVEMMTHRPVTGSLRSSGNVECVLIHLDDRLPGLEMDGYDVEPARIAREPMPRGVID